MELTRRDALLALVGGGLVASTTLAEEVAGGDATMNEADLGTLGALAEVLYPSEVTVSDDFVETYVVGRQAVDDDYRAGLTEAIGVLRETSRQETGQRYASLEPERRDGVLRATGADRAYADPGGTVAQRVRYYLVDGLLYAIYATPKGAGLVGNENPTGYPGGTQVYQRPPEDEGRAER